MKHRIIRTLNNELQNTSTCQFIQVLKTEKHGSAAYMKLVGGLPTQRGLLSSSVPTKAIVEANNKVQKAVGTTD